MKVPSQLIEMIFNEVHLPLAYLPFHRYGQDSALGARRGGIPVQQVLKSISKNKKKQTNERISHRLHHKTHLAPIQHKENIKLQLSALQKIKGHTSCLQTYVRGLYLARPPFSVALAQNSNNSFIAFIRFCVASGFERNSSIIFTEYVSKTPS